MIRRRYLIDAAEVMWVRERLELSQTRFASALGVSRRTIIRGEKRGMELPWKPGSTRANVYDAWCRLSKEAADRRSGDRVLNVTGGRS